MAGNRLQRTGSIFKRMSGLLKTGAIKEEERPLWYDIYKAFPPKYEPTFLRPPVEKKIKALFYTEDVIRGKFLKLYGNAGLYDLKNRHLKSISQRFVEKYLDLEKSGHYSDSDEIIIATEKALESEGLFLNRIPEPRVPEVIYPTKENAT